MAHRETNFGMVACLNVGTRASGICSVWAFVVCIFRGRCACKLVCSMHDSEYGLLCDWRLTVHVRQLSSE